ncbi:hypothetical protein DL93DRAFT_2100013 [Clavulina sp. PMI_390]|nr:hypothetical protein DL93DRAFT_2100013 [Clavulina sp. PMI_390]
MKPQGSAFRQHNGNQVTRSPGGTGATRYGSTYVDSESTLVEVESIVATSDSDLLLSLRLLVKVGQKSSRSRVESSRGNTSPLDPVSVNPESPRRQFDCGRLPLLWTSTGSRAVERATDPGHYGRD